jgi:hypothetical protein
MTMFDSQCDLAALVYGPDQNPDEVLRGFAADLDGRGYRSVGLLQLGHHCLDPELSAMLIHSGERLRLFQDLGRCAQGCRLDVGQLMEAGVRIAEAIDDGADLVVINRFGRQEREGKGLLHVIARALEADIPVVIAVPETGFADWLTFSGGMSVRLRCDRDALEFWWSGVSRRHVGFARSYRQTVCEVLK